MEEDYSYTQTKMTKKNNMIPQINNKKKKKYLQIFTQTPSITNSIYNNTFHNKTVPNKSSNFFENKYINSYFTSRTKNTFNNFRFKNINDLTPKFFFNQYEVPNLGNFHRNLMLFNKTNYKNRMNKLEKERIEKKNKINYNLKEIEKIKLKEDFDTSKYNLRKYLEINKNDNDFLKQYPQKSFDDSIKKIIKKELEDAKIKKRYLIKRSLDIPRKKESLFDQKMKKNKFVSYYNPLIELNQYSTVSLVVDDAESMFKLCQETINDCNKRYNKSFVK